MAWEFLLVAVVVTLTPGPATALIIRVAARDGHRAALGTVVGNSIGILTWAMLSALGVSSLIVASQIAYDVLRFGGAAVLVMLGIRSLLARRRGDDEPEERRRWLGRSPWRVGLLCSLANPKLAVFFVALFPQFLDPSAAVLPAAVAMAGVIVACDLVWYSTLAYVVDRTSRMLKPRIQVALERLTGTVLVGLGIRLAADAR